MVQTASIDYYTIKVAGTGATQSVTGGVNNIQATYNEPYECVNLRAGAMTFYSSVMTTWSRGTLAEAVTGYGKSDAYTLTSEIRVELDDSYYYNEPMQVPGHINQMYHNGTFQMNGKKGYELVATLVTGSEDVSPVLDITRTNMIAVRSLIDNPLPDDEIFGSQETVLTMKNVDMGSVTLTAGSNLAFSNTLDSVTTSHNARIKSINPLTKRVVIEGSFAKEFIKSSTISDTNLAAVGVDAVTTTEGYYYIPETSNDGSVYAKWESRLFEF